MSKKSIGLFLATLLCAGGASSAFADHRHHRGHGHGHHAQSYYPQRNVYYYPPSHYVWSQPSYGYRYPSHIPPPLYQGSGVSVIFGSPFEQRYIVRERYHGHRHHRYCRHD